MNQLIEVKTREELEKAVKNGDIAVVRQGIFTAYGSAQVRAYGSAQVTAYDSAQVTAYGSAQVRAYGSAQVRAYGSAQVRAYDSAQVRAYDSAQVRAYGSAQVTASDSAQVTASGYVAITTSSDTVKVKKGKACHLIKVPELSDIKEYCTRYPIETKGKFIFLYKAVSESFKSLCSSTPITYPTSGIVTCEKIDPPEKGSCANGLHFAHFDRAVQFGLRYDNFVILKARIAKDSIVVSPDCDGKVRTDEAEIVEVIKDWQHYNPDKVSAKK